MADSRRYTDEEFALILRTALESEATRPGPPLRRQGMTLEEMQAIAREVGVAPEQVARAARLISLGEETPHRSLLGGPTKLSSRWTTEAPLAPQELEDVISAVRQALGYQGEVVSELTAVTWRSVGEIPQIFVTLRPREDDTEIQVRMDRGVSFTLTWFLTVTVFLVLAGATGDALAPEGILGGALYLLSFLSAGLVAARTLWAVNSRKAQARFRTLVDVVGQMAAAAAPDALPGETEGPPSPPGAPGASEIG